MSETKYTPGPWAVRELHEDQWEIIRPEFPKGHCIASLSVWGDDELKANAYLIAAAPELLEACKQALKESGCDGDLCTYYWHDAVRAAIAKAEGK